MISVITPTYNRQQKLIELYQSLENQTNKNFEWVVVDDGSTDGTEEYIKNLNPSFNIRFYQKENGGKHTALNYGISRINSELTFIVDSDDRLTNDAIETIYHYHCKYSNNDKLCGYSFLRCYPDGRTNGKSFSADERIGSYIDIRINSDDTHSDKAEVFLTKCLKEFPFPEYPGERFLGEDLIWLRMGRKYNMVYINKGIYIGEYLEGGLTKTRRKNNIESPLGCMERANEFMDPALKIRYRIKAVLQYVIYGKFARKSASYILGNTNNKLLTTVMYIPGLILFLRWKKEYRK